VRAGASAVGSADDYWRLVFSRIDTSKLTPRLYRETWDMWSDLLVACLISLPALIYGAVQWLTYLQ
jgi:hypothetical protein